MNQSQSSPDSSVKPVQPGDAEPLGHLYKMSATAGVATTDYAAINTIAIAAVLLGVASVLVLFNSYLLFIPIAGAICGVCSIRQIRNSNGTQVGGFLAWGGLLLSLGLGGGVAGYDTVQALEARADQREIAALMDQMGRDIRDSHFDTVYASCSDRFRGRVSADLFASRFKELTAVPELGKLQSISWNQQRMLFETNPDTKAQTATAMAFEQMEKIPEPIRTVMVFVKEGGTWKLSDIPQMFPIPKAAAPVGQ